MERAKPTFMIRKYRSILSAAIVVESVNYIITLTDGIIAGNMLGRDALVAIGLLSPFLALSLFMASIINSGTIMQLSSHIGAFRKQRALEFFSQGVYMALLTGAAYAAVLLAACDLVISWLSDVPVIREYMKIYFNTMLLFFVLNPLSYLLDNAVITDGGEKLPAVSNVVFIGSNIVLSYLLALLWGVRGVALGSVISKLVFVIMIGSHFLGKRNSLGLVRCWNFRDCRQIVRCGIVKASNYLLEGVSVFALNVFVSSYFDIGTITLLVVVEKFLGLLTVFIGLSMAAQPLIGTLNGEKNNKALCGLMKIVCRDMVTAGILLTAITVLFTPLLVRAFGMTDGLLYEQAIHAIRIVSLPLMLHALLVLFFIYYYLIDRQRLAFLMCVFKNVISPVALVVLCSVLMKSPLGIWIGLACAPLFSLVICGLPVFRKCTKTDKREFPFLLSHDNDRNTFIYDFEINAENAVEKSRTADSVLRAYGISEKTRALISLFIEEMVQLIKEKNPDAGKKLMGECTIVVLLSGVQLIMRDSGKPFDITNGDESVTSFRQYVISNLMNAQENKAYILTTGYNRVELMFGK